MAMEKKAKPDTARRNTFQRMLDLEQRNKVNRMQASNHPSQPRTSMSQSRDSISNQEFRPPLQAHGRAMSTPALSLSIPPTQVSNGTRKYVVKPDGELIPQEEELSTDSDASSICQSPGWDAAKQRKKEKREREKRKKEKEKSELKELKQDSKSKSRLSKIAPTNKRISKMAIPMDRSESAPAIPQTAPKLPEVKTEEPKKIMEELKKATEAPKKAAETSKKVAEVPRKTEEETKKSSPTRKRRGSLEVGFKSFISTHYMGVPWKSTSSHNTPTETPTHEVPSRPPVTKNGFIGGLKLRQSEEAATQETIRQVKASGGEDARGLLNNDSTKDLTPRPASSGTSITDSVRPISIYEESIRTPQQWDSIYTQAAKIARGPDPVVDDNTPIMERNIRKQRRSHPPTSTRYFPPEPIDVAARDTSSTRASVTSDQKSPTGSGKRSSSIISLERFRRGSSEGQDENRGRASNSYVRTTRQKSRDISVSGLQDDPVTEKRQESRRRSFFGRSRSRARDSSRGASTIKAPDESVSTGEETSSSNPFTDDSYPLPSLHLGSMTSSPADERPPHLRKASKSTIPGMKGLKVAAKAAFTKNSTAPESPTESFVSAVEFPPSLKSKNSRRTLSTTVLDVQNNKSAERILGQAPPTIVHDFAIPRKNKRSHPPNTQSNRSGKSGSSSSNSRGSHSRSVTDSSEEYSTLDDFSNITTPTLSRPQSEKGYFPPMEDIKINGSESSLDEFKFELPLMTGGLDDAASGRDSWCRTAMPMELTEDEDRMKTPTGKKSISDFKAELQEPLPKPTAMETASSKSTNNLLSSKEQSTNPNPTPLNRQPSLSRSISTPELQDLSFLPALKHQALTKPQKSKGKGILGRKNRQNSISKDSLDSQDKTLVRPPPLQSSTTKSEGSSPTSPLSSQYLEKARMALPRPNPQSHSHPRSPKFPPHPANAPANANLEPIAKMFVICCSCKYFHDMPSKIYECMAKPDNVVEDRTLGVSGVISTSVKCPWCGHGMSTACCNGYAAVVYLRERLH